MLIKAFVDIGVSFPNPAGVFSECGLMQRLIASSCAGIRIAWTLQHPFIAFHEFPEQTSLYPWELFNLLYMDGSSIYGRKLFLTAPSDYFFHMLFNLA